MPNDLNTRALEIAAAHRNLTLILKQVGEGRFSLSRDQAQFLTQQLVDLSFAFHRLMDDFADALEKDARAMERVANAMHLARGEPPRDAQPDLFSVGTVIRLPVTHCRPGLLAQAAAPGGAS